MRNLKRALSLALASVMLLGMMVVGTSAASFDDVTSDHHVEAIEVLKAVGVMQGDEGTNNLRPDDNVSRNEMAAVMARLILGAEAETYRGTSPFTDVPGWAQKYVAACYDNKIINGRSATTYDGSATVTAVEAAAMMMRALGYFQNSGDYQNGFKSATVRQAAEINLFNNVAASTDSPMNRNDVAQLALNTLEADVVSFTGVYGTDIKTPDGTSIQVNYVSKYDPKGDSVGYDYKGDGYALVAASNRTHQATYLQLCEKLYENDLKKTGAQDDKDGRPTTEWTYKGQTIKAAETAAVVFSTEQTEEDVARALRNYKISKDSTATPATTANMSDKGVSATANGAQVQTNGGTPSAFSSAATDTAAKAIANLTGNGTAVEIYANGSNVITKIVVLQYGVAKVTSVSESKDGAYTKTTYTLDSGFAARSAYTDPAKADDNNIMIVNGSVAKDDIVIVLQLANQSRIWKAESFTGTQTAYSTGKSTITVDGQVYTVADSVVKNNSASPKVTVAMGDFSGYNDSELTCWVDLYGNVVKAEGIASNDYAVITDIKWATDSATLDGGKAIARLIFPDGTTKDVTLNKMKNGTADVGFESGGPTLQSSGTAKHQITSAESTNKTAFRGLIVTYKEKSDGKYDLTVKNAGGATVNDATSDGNKTAITTKGKPGFAGGTGHNDTVYIIRNVTGSGDVKYNAYVGYANVPTIEADNGGLVGTYSYATNSAGRVTYVFVDAGTTTVDTGKTNDVVYILDEKDMDATKTASDTRYTYNNAALNGEAGSVVADSNTYFTAPGLYEVKRDKDGVVTGTVAVGDKKYTALQPVQVGAEEGSLQVNGTSYAYNSDTKAYVITDKDFAVGDPTAASAIDQVYIKVKGTSGKDAVTVEVMYIVKRSGAVVMGNSATAGEYTSAMAGGGTAVVDGASATIPAGVSVPAEGTLAVKGDATIPAEGLTVSGGALEVEGAIKGTGTVTAGNGSSVTAGGIVSGAKVSASGTAADPAKVEINGSIAGAAAVTAGGNTEVTVDLGDNDTIADGAIVVTGNNNVINITGDVTEAALTLPASGTTTGNVITINGELVGAAAPAIQTGEAVAPAASGLTIPAGVKVIVNGDVSATVTVKEGGTMTVNGTLLAAADIKAQVGSVFSAKAYNVPVTIVANSGFAANAEITSAIAQIAGTVKEGMFVLDTGMYTDTVKQYFNDTWKNIFWSFDLNNKPASTTVTIYDEDGTTIVGRTGSLTAGSGSSMSTITTTPANNCFRYINDSYFQSSTAGSGGTMKNGTYTYKITNGVCEGITDKTTPGTVTGTVIYEGTFTIDWGWNGQ